MAVLPEFFRKAVVAIGIQDASRTHWIATGFIVGRQVPSNPARSYLFLITNKHVIASKERIIMRFNNENGSGICDVSLTLNDKNGYNNYSAHPTKSIDVVACALHAGNIRNANSELSWFNLDTHALTLKQMRETGVDEGSLVYSIGFPMGKVLDRIKAPFIRMGCVSRIADAFSGVGDSSYFIDAQSFPGNSGGPVVNKPEQISIKGTPHNSSANLIGVLNSYLPYKEDLISQQTGEVVMRLHENTGLTKVYPVDCIMDVVNMEMQRCWPADVSSSRLQTVGDQQSA